MTFPAPEDHIIRTRQEARKYKQAFEAHLKETAGAFTQDLLAVDDPTLREAVAYMCEALAQRHGHLDARTANSQGNYSRDLEFFHLDLDEDLADAYDARFGEEMVEEAALWIFDWIRENQPLTAFVPWALGQIHIRGTNAGKVLEERVLFDLNTCKPVKVYSHHDWQHPHCKTFRV